MTTLLRQSSNRSSLPDFSYKYKIERSDKQHPGVHREGEDFVEKSSEKINLSVSRFVSFICILESL